MKDLYTEKYKTLPKEIQKTKQMERHLLLMIQFSSVMTDTL